jgi:hypothetical protein
MLITDSGGCLVELTLDREATTAAAEKQALPAGHGHEPGERH